LRNRGKGEKKEKRFEYSLLQRSPVLRAWIDDQRKHVGRTRQDGASKRRETSEKVKYTPLREEKGKKGEMGGREARTEKYKYYRGEKREA